MNFDTAFCAFIHLSKFKNQKPLLRIEKFVRSAIFVAFRKQSEMKKNVKYIISTPSPKKTFVSDTQSSAAHLQERTIAEKIARFKHLFYLCRQIEKYYGSQQ